MRMVAARVLCLCSMSWFVIFVLHAYMRTYMHTCITYRHICMHAYTYIHPYRHTPHHLKSHQTIFRYTHIHTHIHTCAHACIHNISAGPVRATGVLDRKNIYAYMHIYIYTNVALLRAENSVLLNNLARERPQPTDLHQICARSAPDLRHPCNSTRWTVWPWYSYLGGVQWNSTTPLKPVWYEQFWNW